VEPVVMAFLLRRVAKMVLLVALVVAQEAILLGLS
jgi:hypothetical protein